LPNRFSVFLSPAGVYNAGTSISFADMKTLFCVLLLLSFVTASKADDDVKPIANEAAIATATENAAALVVDTAFVAEAIQRGAILWDARVQDEFRKGHIPGAVNIGDPLRVLRSENSEDFIPQELIEEFLGNAGLNPAKEIVVYAGKATPSAYFGLYVLQFFGADNVHVYHGGIDDWKVAGRPISAQIMEPAPIKLSLLPRPEIAIDTTEVLNKLDRSEVQILDVRCAAGILPARSIFPTSAILPDCRRASPARRRLIQRMRWRSNRKPICERFMRYSIPIRRRSSIARADRAPA
jgi:3-mercaptopyruvate sulfurtransferase SseA